MSDADNQAGGERLGRMLRTRRERELDPRYYNRKVFALERGINYKLAYDIEKHRRADFAPLTLEEIADAYQVTYESVVNVLEHGGDLVPAPPADVAREAGSSTAPGADPSSVARFSPQMQDLMRPHLAAIAVRVESARRARAAVGRDPDATPSGAEVFGKGEDAISWDNLTRRLPASMHDLLPVMLAELLALEELRDNQQRQDDEAPGSALRRS